MNVLAEQPRERLSFAAVPMDQAGGGGMLAPKSLGEVVAFAQVMARADLALPKHLRGNDGACMAVAMQAMRWELDPFAVANKSYFVNDRIAYEAQLVAAVVHTRAPIAKRPDYSYAGEGATRRCTITCEMRDGTVRTYESPMLGQIKVQNSPLWKSDPDQQLGYFAIRSWARRHTPEVILGVYTPDEVETIRDVTPREGTGLAARLKAAPAAAGADGFARPIEQESSDASATSPAEGDVSGEPPAAGADEAAPLPPISYDLSNADEADVRAWVETYRAAFGAAVTPEAVMQVRRAAFDGGQLKAVFELDGDLQAKLDEEVRARAEALKAPPAEDDDFPGDKPLKGAKP